MKMFADTYLGWRKHRAEGFLVVQAVEKSCITCIINLSYRRRVVKSRFIPSNSSKGNLQTLPAGEDSDSDEVFGGEWWKIGQGRKATNGCMDPSSKFLVTAICKPFSRPFGRGPTTRSLGDLLSILINHLHPLGMILQVTLLLKLLGDFIGKLGNSLKVQTPQKLGDFFNPKNPGCYYDVHGT